MPSGAPLPRQPPLSCEVGAPHGLEALQRWAAHSLCLIDTFERGGGALVCQALQGLTARNARGSPSSAVPLLAVAFAALLTCLL